MIKNIWKRLWKSEGQEELFTPRDIETSFVLTWRRLEIGVLSLKEGKWTFRYSEDFKAQETVKPLTDFPDVNKVYSSEELYPFFLSRIPGSGQTKFQEIVKKEKIDPKNEAELLKRFGRQTIANSFILTSV